MVGDSQLLVILRQQVIISPLSKTCFHILNIHAFHKEEVYVGYLGKQSQWGSREKCGGGVYVMGKGAVRVYVVNGDQH